MSHHVSIERQVRPGLTAWLAWVSFGELVGFCVPSAAGALLSGAPAVLFLVTMIAAGTIEGTVLGVAQSRVLAPAVGVRPRAWVVATATGAAIAWTAGMLPSTYELGWQDRDLGSSLALVTLALVVLASIGTAQWVVLRRHVPGSGGWIWATALAWCIGLASFALVTTPLWRPGQATVQILGVGLMGGLVMAATMALVTGLWLRRRHLL